MAGVLHLRAAYIHDLAILVERRFLDLACWRRIGSVELFQQVIPDTSPAGPPTHAILTAPPVPAQFRRGLPRRERRPSSTSAATI